MKIVVLGAGPGGYEAAIYAAKKGAEVTLIEKNALGGTCLNRGCIPTKALLASYDAYQSVKDCDDFGINVTGEISVDYEKIINRKNKIVSNLVKGINYLENQNGVNLVEGFGKLIDKNTIEVTKSNGETEKINADYIILATGSVPMVPKMFNYDGKRVITSNEILDMSVMPKSLILVGGGVIGCEIGQFLAKMGCEVTIVEMMDQILPSMDEDVVKPLLRQFKKDKIKVITGDGIAEVKSSDSDVSVVLQSGKELSAEYVLVAIGRRAFSENCGFENVGIATNERGQVIVNEHLQTNVDNIYAIGDIIPSAMLAHVAVKEGFVAVDNIMGESKCVNYDAVPSCVYTNPEIATVGKTQKELDEENIEYNVGTFDFKTLGKAQASGHIAGFVKVIADKDDVLIGASVVGSRATDMLQVLTNAVHFHQKAQDVLDAIFPHPTMSEAIMEALHDLHKMSINKG